MQRFTISFSPAQAGVIEISKVYFLRIGLLHPYTVVFKIAVAQSGGVQSPQSSERIGQADMEMLRTPSDRRDPRTRQAAYRSTQLWI